MKEWGNSRELSTDLASHTDFDKWMSWPNMPLGSVQYSYCPIADVISISKSYQATCGRSIPDKVTKCYRRNGTMPSLLSVAVSCGGTYLTEGRANMTAAIYCRVSTDNQEREGTSLQTQLEACLDLLPRQGPSGLPRLSIKRSCGGTCLTEKGG